MSVVNDQKANEVTFNTAFMSRLDPETSTVAKVLLENAEPESGAPVDNVQQAINETFDTVGIAGTGDVNRKVYGATYIADGDDHKTALVKLDAETTAQDGRLDAAEATLTDHETRIDSLETSVADHETRIDSLETSVADHETRIDSLETSVADHETRIDSLESGDMVIGGEKTFSGNMLVQGNFTVLGAATHISSTDTDLADRNITLNKNGTDATAEGGGITVEGTGEVPLAGVVYDSTLASKWKVGLIGSLREVLVSGVAQVVEGLKSFVDGLKTDTITEYTLDAGVTVEDVLLKDGLVDGRDVAADGVALDAAVVAVADHETRIGTLETTVDDHANRIGNLETQVDDHETRITELETITTDHEDRLGTIEGGDITFTGVKTFSGKVIMQAQDIKVLSDDTATGTDATLTLPATSVVRLTNPALVSVRGIPATLEGMRFVLINETGSDVVLKNNVGAVPEDGIVTGLGADFTFKNGAALVVQRSTGSNRWHLVGAYSGGTGGAVAKSSTVFKLNGSYGNIVVPDTAVDGLFVAPEAIKIVDVIAYNLTAGSSGTTELDIKVKPQVGGAFTSIFLTTPKITSGAGNNVWVGVGDAIAGTTAPILSVSPFTLAAKTAMRFDIITKQGGTPADCGLIVIYEKV